MSSDKKPNSFVFAAVLCIITSLCLTGAAVGLKDRQDINVKVDQQKNILKALGLLNGAQKLSNNDVQTLYESSVVNVFITKEGNLSKSETEYPIFVVQKDGYIESYALPFSAYGLWSWVYGYVAFDGDGETVRGLTVYQHGETPGLGGEVEKEWFQRQFVGKKITDKSGLFVSVGIVKGKVEEKIAIEKQDNFVDGISGATITSQGMQKYLKLDIQNYENFAKKLRKETHAPN
jgi:Na+-transporting NADH:ubiquinone oxidoreductase subunit C